MSEKLERTLALQKEGANCAQSVACAFCEDYGVKKDDMMRMTASYGGGMCVGEVCGAAAGGMAVVGLKYGFTDGSDKEAKKLCKGKGREFMLRFREVCGDVRCADMLGCDINTPEGFAQAKDLIKVKCKETVIKTTQLLEEIQY